MSEADTPNNQPLPEPTASMDDSATDLPEVTETSDPQTVNISELPSLMDVVEHSRQKQISDLVVAASSIAEVDDRATDEMPDASLGRTKDASDWFALAQKMRQRNRRLLDQVTELKAALREKQEALHSELMRSRERETLIVRQAEELNTVQEQLARMFHALESSHQAAQRQQILIETLSEQLQSSQERVAQLERECALMQQRYNEQSHQLLQAANTCRELRTRLVRQQRQTMQFKVALEKSLEMNSPSKAAGQQQPHQKGSIAYSSLVPKTQPIQPWSAEPEIVEDTSIDTIWKRPLRLEPLPEIYSSEVEPFEIRRTEETDLPLTADPSEPRETAIASSKESDASELELEQQLLAEMSSLAQASGLSESPSYLADAQAPITPDSGTSPDESNNPEQFLIDAEKTPLPEDFDELDSEAEMQDEDLWDDSADSETDQPNEVVLPQSNWPSPTLYPLRPPKRRKSLAAIELPSFPRLRPS
jgi:hypothetical protein